MITLASSKSWWRRCRRGNAAALIRGLTAPPVSTSDKRYTRPAFAALIRCGERYFRGQSQGLACLTGRGVPELLGGARDASMSVGEIAVRPLTASAVWEWGSGSSVTDALSARARFSDCASLQAGHMCGFPAAHLGKHTAHWMTQCSSSLNDQSRRKSGSWMPDGECIAIWVWHYVPRPSHPRRAMCDILTASHRSYQGDRICN
jgi:hypothetical protein